MESPTSSGQRDHIESELFEQGVLEHARYLGIDPGKDANYLFLARESLVAPLPEGWTQEHTEDGIPYYYDSNTGNSTWEHPLDQYYINRFHDLKSKEAHRQENSSDSISNSPTTEESTKQSTTGHVAHDQELDSGSYATKSVDAAASSTGGSIFSFRAQSNGTPYTTDNTYDGGGYGASYARSGCTRCEDREELADRARRQADTIDLLKSGWKSSQREVADLRTRLEDAESRHKQRKLRHEKDLAKLRSEVKQWKDEFEWAEMEIQELKAMHAEESQTHQQRREQEILELRRVADAAARAMIADKEKQMEEMQARLEARGRALQEELDAAQRENVRLQTLAEHLDKHSAEIETALRKATVTNGAVREGPDVESQKHSHRMEELRKQWGSEVSVLKAELQSATESRDDLQRRLESHKQELREKDKEWTEKISQLHEQRGADISSMKAEVERLNSLVNEERTRLEESRRMAEDLRREKRSLEGKIEVLERAGQQQEAEIASAREVGRQEGVRSMQTEMDKMARKLEETVALYKEEVVRRRALHNEIMEIQGNIRVYCRVRPVQDLERRNFGVSATDVCLCPPDDNQVLKMDALDVLAREDRRVKSELESDKSAGRWSGNVDRECSARREKLQAALSASLKSTQSFEFDRVFSQAADQEEVFGETEALVTSALDGYNVAVFAYGQTGSGKTFTMEGPESNRGVNYRALEKLFSEIGNREQMGDRKHKLRVSMLEVYNETIVDLLASAEPSSTARALDASKSANTLDIRVIKNKPFVAGLSQVAVESMKEVDSLMKKGHARRRVGSHNANEHSSRSHLVFTIYIDVVERCDIASDEAQEVDEDLVSSSKLNLIDLAGSERISKTEATGQQLKEAQNINRSLSALGDVIAALGSAQKHIPYRNSKLTFLLSDSLGGGSKVLMFVNLSPALANASESICSLNFAQRCRSVALGRAEKQTIRSSQPKIKPGSGGLGTRGTPNSPASSKDSSRAPSAGRMLLNHSKKSATRSGEVAQTAKA